MSWWGHIWKRLALGGDDSVARRGEKEAAAFLAANGYSIVGQNLRIGKGEIDLVAIAPDGRSVVIVEVKAAVIPSHLEDRKRLHRPEDHVTPAKEKQLARLASMWVKSRKWTDRPVRFDVIGVDLPQDGKGKPVIRHHKAAFQSYF